MKLEKIEASAYSDTPGHRSVPTSVEAAEACGLDRWSIQPRTSELRRKRLIVDSGQRRLNASRKRAIVWTLPQYEQAAPK